MQVRAAQLGFRATERPVSYKPRIGHSKISGTVSGTILAGRAILGTIFLSAIRDNAILRRLTARSKGPVSTT